ncbi:unnamed protein product [Agarophyton chilense]
MDGFVPYPSFFLSQSKKTESNSPITRRRRHVVLAGHGLKHRRNKSTKHHVKTEENGETSASSRANRPEVDKIARSLANAKNRYERISDEVRALHELPDDYILGADLSDLYIGATSIVQDFPVPDAPAFHGLSPREVLTIAEDFLRGMEVSNEDRTSLMEGLKNILISLRNWVSDIKEEAKLLVLAQEDMEAENDPIPMTAFVHLLQLGRFSIMPSLPTIDEPPPPELIPLGTSKEETLDTSIIINHDVRNIVVKQQCDLRKESFYPYVFVATRGVSVMRNSGLLLSLKFRAIERSYLGWIAVPFTLLTKPSRVFDWVKSWLSDPKKDPKRSINMDGRDSRKNSSQGDHGNLSSRAVRRIVPAVRLKSFRDAVRSLFFPSFTQEPCHEMLVLMYREIEQDRNILQKLKRAALMKQIKESMSQAIDPFAAMKSRQERKKKDAVAGPMIEDFVDLKGNNEPVSLQLYKDIPWGLEVHYFPSIYVLPATGDLLRLDAVTIFGLISAAITYVQHLDNWFCFAFLLGSLMSYVVRVASGWRKAATKYREKIANDKVTNVVAQQWAALDSLGTLAVEEAFAQLTAVFLAMNQGNGKSAIDVELAMYKNGSLDATLSSKWEKWLVDKHLHDA